MDSASRFLLTIAIAAVSGLIGWGLKLPAGPTLGAMAGSRMDMDEVKSMKKLFLPILPLVLSMFMLNVTFGGAIYR